MPPVLAEVNALGKEVVSTVRRPSRSKTEDVRAKVPDLTEVDSLIKTNSKVKNGFVPGKEGTSAKTQALGRSRRIRGVKKIRRGHSAEERHS